MTIQSIPLSSILPPDGNPRTAIDQAGIEGLAASIQADGLLQNLVVVPLKGRKPRYRLISGERRYRALKLLEERGVLLDDHAVPVDIRAGLSAEDSLRLATVENLQRENLTPLEEAAAFARMIQDGIPLEDLAARTGLSVSTLKRRLALASLCDEAKTALESGALTLGQAEALTLGTHETQRDLLQRLEDGFHYDADDTPLAPKPKPAYSEVLCRYIAHHKSMAVQHLLLANPRKAREVAVLLLLGASDHLPSVNLSRHDCLRTFAQADEPPASYQDMTQQAKRLAAALGLTEEGEEDAGWQQLRCSRGDATTLYESLKALNDADLDRLHLLLTILCFGQGDINRLDAADTLFNRVARDLGADMRAYWRPDTDFLSRRTRAPLEQIVHESGLSGRLGHPARMTKAELVRKLMQHFARVHDLSNPADNDLKARDRLPDAMRFPAGEPAPAEVHTEQDADPTEKRDVLRRAA